MASQATRMAREISIAADPVNTAGNVTPTEGEIARIAFDLWLESGCPVGSDKENWFRAKAILLEGARTGGILQPAFASMFSRGHWEVWEREWGGARWVWDVR